jgi:hypothetical protein
VNKEEAYDAEISPLMTQIIAICKTHGIAMVCSFAIPTEADADLGCTSVLPSESGKSPLAHLQALEALMGERLN